MKDIQQLWAGGTSFAPTDQNKGPRASHGSGRSSGSGKTLVVRNTDSNPIYFHEHDLTRIGGLDKQCGSLILESRGLNNWRFTRFN